MIISEPEAVARALWVLVFMWLIMCVAAVLIDKAFEKTKTWLHHKSCQRHAKKIWEDG